MPSYSNASGGVGVEACADEGTGDGKEAVRAGAIGAAVGADGGSRTLAEVLALARKRLLACLRLRLAALSAGAGAGAADSNAGADDIAGAVAEADADAGTGGSANAKSGAGEWAGIAAGAVATNVRI